MIKNKKGFGFIGFLFLVISLIIFVSGYSMIKGIIDPFIQSSTSPLMKVIVISLPAIAFFFIIFRGLQSNE